MISERAFAKSFSTFWKELLPLLSPRFIALFNETSRRPLLDRENRPLKSIDADPSIRADIVAEFAFWATALATKAGASVLDLSNESEFLTPASRRAFELVNRYEGARPSDFQPLTPNETEQGLLLAKNYDAVLREHNPIDRIEFCPQFRGSGYLNAAEGDLGINSTLIEIKTTVRGVSGRDIRQLLIYLALDSAASLQRWDYAAIFNPRRATYHQIGVDSLISQISGGQARFEVLNELADFVQSNDLIIDRRF